MKQKKALELKKNDYSLIEKKYFKASNTNLLDPFSPPKELTRSKRLTAAIIIAARNVKASILSCLISIEQSSFNLKHPDRLQVIVVDDGSNDGTWELIKKNAFSLHLTVIKQKHHGQAQALNTGIAVSENDIVISCDADMILSYYAIEQLMTRHQLLPNVLLTGFRSDVSEGDSKINPNYIRQHGSHQYSYLVHDERIDFPIPGFPENMCLTSNHYKNLGHFRGIWMRRNFDPWLLSDLVIGALFSLSKSTYYEIGGYDERLIGYGSTDGYLASKAISAGTVIIPVYAASGLHINHPARTANKSLEYENNRRLFYSFIESSQVRAYPNWLANAKKRIIELYTQKPKISYSNTHNINGYEPDYYRIDTLLAVGRYTEALVLLSNNTGKNIANVASRKGKANFMLGKYINAIDDFKEAETTNPEAAVNIARTQAANQQYRLAHETLMTFAKKFPKSSLLTFWQNQSTQFHITQGEKFFQQGFYDTAIHCFEHALICEPNNATALTRVNICISLSSN